MCSKFEVGLTSMTLLLSCICLKGGDATSASVCQIHYYLVSKLASASDTLYTGERRSLK